MGTVCLLFGLGGSCGFTCFGLVGAFSKTGLSLFQVPFPGSGYVMSYYVFKTPSPLAPVVRSPPCHATSSSSPTRGAPKPCTHDAHLFFQRPPYACTSKCMSVISPPLSGAAEGCVRGPPLLRTRRRHRVDADQPGPMSAKTLCSPCADSRCPVEFEKKTFLPLCMRRRVSNSLPATYQPRISAVGPQPVARSAPRVVRARDGAATAGLSWPRASSSDFCSDMSRPAARLV